MKYKNYSQSFYLWVNNEIKYRNLAFLTIFSHFSQLKPLHITSLTQKIEEEVFDEISIPKRKLDERWRVTQL